MQREEEIKSAGGGLRKCKCRACDGDRCYTYNQFDTPEEIENLDGKYEDSFSVYHKLGPVD